MRVSFRGGVSPEEGWWAGRKSQCDISKPRQFLEPKWRLKTDTKRRGLCTYDPERVGITRPGLYPPPTPGPRLESGGAKLLYPQFCFDLFLTLFCRLSVPSLGHPNCLKPTVPRTPFKIPCLKVAHNPFFSFFLSTVRAKPWSALSSF